MLISKKWINEFVTTSKDLTDAELAQKITLSTVEVEGMKDQASVLEKIVLGVIKTVVAHPNADKLRVCHVDVGSHVVQIVCGGTNVAAGMKVAVALPGALVKWHATSVATDVAWRENLTEIKQVKLRGVDSEGMICSSNEIGLSPTEDDHEIRDLGDIDEKAGTPLASVLGLDDVIFDIEHKSLTNRPDLMGHYGMAREVAALTKSKLKIYEPKKIAAGKGIDISVEVADKEACPRYMAVAMEGIVVGESPEWVKRRLEACGVRSISNVVDVTNFVMLELGQPMHAFDADVLGKKIVVRVAKPKEKITALDEKTYELDPSMLLITDGKKPMAIAGVMGGEGSGVSEATTRIVFESANFDPVSVRKTSTKLGLRSESSARFEKSLDPNLCELALRRAVELMSEFSPGARVASKVVDEYPRPPKAITVSLTSELVNDRLGTNISVTEMTDILERLGFDVRAKKGELTVTIPSWRATKDVQIVEDVIEEIARVWGYERIEGILPTFEINPPAVDPVRDLARRLRNTMTVGVGATEVYRYAFVAPEPLKILGFETDDHLKLANPLAEDRPYLVQSLVPNLFDTVKMNHRAFPVVSVFEIARVFFGKMKGDPAVAPGGAMSGEEDGQGGTLPVQPYHFGVAYSVQGDQSPIIELRRQVETVLTAAGFAVEFVEMNEPAQWMHPARAAQILVGGKQYGVLAEARPDIAEAFSIDRRVAIAEMNLTMLAELERVEASFSPIPQYPDAKRDIAFTVAERTTAANIEKAVRGASDLLVEYDLFDLYRGKGVEEGQKSMAVHLTLRANDKTLETSEVDEEMKKICQVLEKEFGATLRS